MSVNISIAYHSGFRHTERQARAVTAVAKSTGATVRIHDVTTLDDALWTHWPRPRSSSAPPTGAQPPRPSSPSLGSSRIWAAGGWRDKRAARFTNCAGINGDKLKPLETMSVFATQHGMTWAPSLCPRRADYMSSLVE